MAKCSSRFLEMIQSQSHGFESPQPTHKQQCEQAPGHVFFSDDRVPAKERVPARPLTSSPRAYPAFHSFNPPNAGRQVGGEKAAVSRFICEPTHGAKTQID